MKIIFYADLIVFFIVLAICTFIGLDLKKWQSWLAGLYGFLSGWSLGFLVGAGSSGWQLGLLFAIAIMYSGAVMRHYRIYYRKAGEEWLKRYGQDKRFPFLARIIEKFLRK